MFISALFWIAVCGFVLSFLWKIFISGMMIISGFSDGGFIGGTTMIGVVLIQALWGAAKLIFFFVVLGLIAIALEKAGA